MKKLRSAIVIAFTGPMTVGKDTAAEALKAFLDERGIRTASLKFATPVKEAFSDFYRHIYPEGYVETQGFKHSKLPNGKRVRDALVHIGNGMRAFDPDIWVRFMPEEITPGAVNIISDLRYDNEALFVKGKHRHVGIPQWCDPEDWTGIVVELSRSDVKYSGIEGERQITDKLIDYRYSNLKMTDYGSDMCPDIWNELWRLGLITKEFYWPGKKKVQ